MSQVLLHVAAIAQAVFLPGYIIWRLMRPSTSSLVHASLLVASLSALANFMLASVMATLGIGLSTAIFWVLALEVVAVVALVVSDRSRHAPRDAEIEPGAERTAPSTLALAAATAGLAIAAAILLISLKKYGAVFQVWDPLFSWNEWALDWWSGRFPDITWMYPQLIPANWAVSYAILGSVELQALPKAMMALYPVASVLLLAATGLRKRSLMFILASVLLGAVILAGFMPDVDSGGVELAAGFFALAAICFLPDPRNPFARAQEREYLPALALAVASACTKQSGLLVLLFVAAATVYGTAQFSASRIRPRTATVLRMLAVLGAVGVVGYLPGYLMMASPGLAATSYVGIQAAMGYAPVTDRLAVAARMVASQQPWLLALVALLLVAMLRGRFRAVGAFLVVPWLIVWAVTLSYDFRNLAFIVPLWCLSAASAFGDRTWREHAVSRLMSAASAATPIAAALAVALVAVAFVVMNGGTLASVEADQLERQARIPSPELNASLEALLAEDLEGATILTDFRYLPQMPLYRSDPRRTRLTEGVSTTYLDFNGVMPRDIAAGADFMILSDRLPEETERAVDSAIASGEYIVLAEFKGAWGVPGGEVLRVLKRAD